MVTPILAPFVHVICRIGSLEILKKHVGFVANVICRIGSLEMIDLNATQAAIVICRIGRLYIS